MNISSKIIFSVLLIFVGIGIFIFAQDSSLPPSAQTYAPNLWFDSEEKYFPTDPLKFYFDDNLNEVTGQEAVDKYLALPLDEKLKNFQVFYHITDGGNEWIYQYWLFYVKNEFSNDHWGDWESVFVFVDKDTKKIIRIVGSAHGVMNNEIRFSKGSQENNIGVYVGKGSHANCPDKMTDGSCDFWFWKIREGKEWSKNDVIYGHKAFGLYYNLVEFNEDYIKNFDGNKSFDKEKSPDLGWNVTRPLGIKKNLYVDVFGENPEFAWVKPEYNNSEDVRPLSFALVGEKVENFFADALGKFRGNFASLFPSAIVSLPDFSLNNNQPSSENNSESGGTEPDNEAGAESDTGINEEEISPETVKINPEANNEAEEVIEEEVVVDEEITEEEPKLEEDLEVKPNQEIQIAPVICQKMEGAIPQRNRIIINEIAWMGTASSSDEWIELKNISNQAVNLTGWQISDKENQIKIIFATGTIPASGLFLLERTNDDSVPQVMADLIYTGGLNNSNEALYLFGETCQLQDEVIANPDWPAGDNSSKRTMERKSDLYWQTSAEPLGTPKRENSSGFVQPFIPASMPIVPPVPLVISYPKILISEIQIASLDSEKEDFVELYNPNDFEVSLTDWYLQRKTKSASNASSYVKADLFSGKKIGARGYLLIRNASSSFEADIYTGNPLTENNSLILKNPKKEVVDIVGYGEAQEFENQPAPNPPAGKSLGRIYNEQNNNYQDTDNNLSDFQIQSPAPKQNQLALNEKPKAVFSFNPLNPLAGEDLNFDASSSLAPNGLLSLFLWDFGDGGSATSQKSTTTYSFATSGEYLITLSVIDDSGATSGYATDTLKVKEKSKLAQGIVISEVQIKDNEFIEIYNSDNQPINLGGLYLSYFSASLDESGNPKYDWDYPYLNKKFSDISIASLTYYLIGFGDYPEFGGNPEADWKPYKTSLSDNAGAIGIFSCDPKSASSSEEAKNCRADLFSWNKEGEQNAAVFEGTSFSFKEDDLNGKTFQRKKNKKNFYIDDNDNSTDFEISVLTPTNSKNETIDIIPPNAVSDLSMDAANTGNNIVGLIWSAVSDPDTPPEKISYQIYYSKNQEITEDNLNSTSTVSTIATTTSIVIPDLYYKSDYYFAVRASDGRNYSSLSSSVKSNTPSLWENSLWPLPSHDFQKSRLSLLIDSNTEKSIIEKLLQGQVVDPNLIFYSNTTEGILAQYLDGGQKWFYSIVGVTSPVLGNDGTIYALSSDRLTAISPEGKLKWEIIPPGSRPYPSVGISPVISQSGTIYFLFSIRLNDGNFEPALIAVNDFFDQAGIAWVYAIAKEKIYSTLEEFLQESGQGDFPQPIYDLVLDGQENIYFNYGNILFKLDSQGKQTGKRIFSGNMDGTVVGSISIDENNNSLYSLVSQEYFTGGYNGVIFGCFHSLDLENLEDKWSYCDISLIGSMAFSAEGNVYFQQVTAGLLGSFGWLYSYDQAGQRNWLLDFLGTYGVNLMVDREGNIYFILSEGLTILSKEGVKLWPY